MHWPEVRAILFDADGVIVHPKMQFARHLAEVYGLLPQHTRGFFDGAFNECLCGKARLEDTLPPFLSAWRWPGSVEDFIALWLREDNQVDQRLAGAITALRGQGYLCGLATSQERRRAAFMRREMGFAALFDRLFFSCELGCMKPDPQFYAQVEQRLGLSGAAILFWDDAAENVQAARQRGWQAEIYTNFEAFDRP